MKYYCQIVFKENGKINAVTPVITVKALSKSMARRKVTKKCDFMLKDIGNYEIVLGDKSEYKAKFFFKSPCGEKYHEKEVTIDAVSIELAEFKVKLQTKFLSENPIFEILDIKTEIIWEE